MSKMGKHHKPEYKEYVAKLVVEEGREVPSLSYEIDIPIGTIRNWVRKYREKKNRLKGTGEQLTTPADLQQEIQKLRKQNEELQETNEILKKAMHVFAKAQA